MKGNCITIAQVFWSLITLQEGLTNAVVVLN